jgi:hypothetical protein
MNKRTFTRADDEAILRNARGDFGVGILEMLVGADRRTLARRAELLGVKLRARKHHSKMHRPRMYKDEPPIRLCEDPYLAKLQKIYKARQ